MSLDPCDFQAQEHADAADLVQRRAKQLERIPGVIVMPWVPQYPDDRPEISCVVELELDYRRPLADFADPLEDLGRRARRLAKSQAGD